MTLQCSRCGGYPGNGAAIELHGPATGHNHERLLLCDNCLGGLRAYVAGRLALLPDDLPDDLDHNRQRVAERFARKGLAQ